MLARKLGPVKIRGPANPSRPSLVVWTTQSLGSLVYPSHGLAAPLWNDFDGGPHRPRKPRSAQVVLRRIWFATRLVYVESVCERERRGDHQTFSSRAQPGAHSNTSTIRLAKNGVCTWLLRPVFDSLVPFVIYHGTHAVVPRMAVLFSSFAPDRTALVGGAPLPRQRALQWTP